MRFLFWKIYDKVKMSASKTDPICCKNWGCTCCGMKRQQLCHNGSVLIWNKKEKMSSNSQYIRSTKYINWFIRSTAKNIFINWHLIIWSNKSHLIQTTRRLSTFFINLIKFRWLQAVTRYLLPGAKHGLLDSYIA